MTHDPNGFTRKDLAAGLRLDPSLQQGRRGRGLLWAVSSIVALAILVIFFAIGHTDSTAQNQLTPTDNHRIEPALTLT